MKIITSSLALLLLLSISFYAKSQEDVIIDKDAFNIKKEDFRYAWSNVKLADKFYAGKTEGSYMLALEYYLEAYSYNPDNPELNYKIGVSYLGSIFKANGLAFLEKAYQAKSTVAKDIILQLAYAYQYSLNFDKAIEYYGLYKTSVTSAEYKKVKKTVEKKIEECNSGKILVATASTVEITNITAVNTEFPDYCPVISADESMMIFTSRRMETTGGEADKNDGQYYEDIYISNNIDGKWQPAENMGKPLNSQYHDATVGLAPDGQSMLIYKDGDLYVCYLKGDEWTEPELLPEVINTEENLENSACFSPDGNAIYFTRGKTIDPTTSNGDIYVSKKKKGIWGKAIKLNKIVNTEFDEDGVFMHPDGRTLYFSSRGHNTMGGYDIFSTVLQSDGTWSTPVNLGYPINTPDDDIYFVLSADAQHGYYSTVKDDALGFTDIYMINFAVEIPVIDTIMVDSVPVIAEVPIIKPVRVTIVKGIVTDAISLEPIEATIEIYDNVKNELISEQISNSKTGKYLISLPSGVNYGLVVKADNYLFHSENFDIDSTATYNEIIKDISLMPIEQGSKVVLKNIFFDVNKSVLRSESFSELEQLKQFMTENKDVKVEISGHTDNTGSYALNQELSQNRAKAVVDYLIANGISTERLTYRGASYDEPIASNNTDEGKQLNRRVEFKIIE